VIAKKFDELRLTGTLPTPSVVGLRILEITKDDDYDLEELTRTIMADPALSGRVLKLANAALGAGVVTDVATAVRHLGSRTVRGVALSFTLVSDNRTDAARAFDYEAYWFQALATAAAASVFAADMEDVQPVDAFTCGLLYEVGTLALATVHPDRYSDLLEGAPDARGRELAHLETRAFDIDHYEVSAAMLADWGLTPEMQLAALLHERESARLDEPGLESLVTLLRVCRSVAEVLVAPPGEATCALRALDASAALLDMDMQRFLERCDAAADAWAEWGALLGLPVTEADPVSVLHAVAGQAPALMPTTTAPDEACLERAVLPPSVDSIDDDHHEHDAGAPTRILLVDDDERMLKLIGHHLRKEGYEVATSDSSSEGLSTALNFQPQLVITDWMMPGMTGLEMCSTLRQTKTGRRMYVLVVTAREDDERVVEAFAAGADDYIVKPFNPRILLARVRAGQRMVQLREQVEAAERTRLRQVAELGILARKLRAAAMTDPLTDLPNRRYAMKRLKQEWDSSLRMKRPLSVVLADIDNFKEVNDCFGHDAGDAVLRDLSVMLRRVARSGDVLCRLGGEEFLSIHVAATAEEASLGAERLRDAAAALKIEHAGYEGTVTLSLGVAERTPDMVGFDDLIKAADEALYAAKEQGRNRVVIARRRGPHGKSA